MKHPKIVAVLLTTMLAVLALGSTGCEEPGAPKVYRDPANIIYVEVNDEFVIALESNHSTGYSWQLLADGGEAAFDTKVLELVGTEYEAPKGDLVGAPGEEKWTFKGKGPGQAQLHFAYVRPWETGAAQETEAEGTAATGPVKTTTTTEGDHSTAGENAAVTTTTTATGTEITTEAGETEEVAEQETMVFTVDVGPSGATTKAPAEFTYKEGTLTNKEGNAVDAVTANLGTQFALLLESNPTTGYSWQLAEPLDESMVILVSKEYEQSKEKSGSESGGEGETMVGVGGEDVWTFRAVGEGETEISLKYVRPWEPASPEDETITVTVNIEKGAEE